MLEKYEKLSEKINSNIAGICLFCQKIITKTQVKKGPKDYAFAPKTLLIKFEDRKMQKEVGGFFCCNGCLGNPIKVTLFTEVVTTHIDLETLNQEIANVIQKEAITKKYQEELKEKLQKVKVKDKEVHEEPQQSRAS